LANPFENLCAMGKEDECGPGNRDCDGTEVGHLSSFPTVTLTEKEEKRGKEGERVVLPQESGSGCEGAGGKPFAAPQRCRKGRNREECGEREQENGDAFRRQNAGVGDGHR